MGICYSISRELCSGRAGTRGLGDQGQGESPAGWRGQEIGVDNLLMSSPLPTGLGLGR